MILYMSHEVKWMILGGMLPGWVLPEHPVDLRFWLSGAVDSGETFWLSVHCRRAMERRGFGGAIRHANHLLETAGLHCRWPDSGELRFKSRILRKAI